MKIWEKLNGIKTKIGAAIVIIAQVGQAVAPDIAPWSAVEQVGIWIAGVGLLHTVTKKAGVNL